MDFKRISSTPQAIKERARIASLGKVKQNKDSNLLTLGYLKKSTKLNKRVCKNLRTVINDPNLVKDYLLTSETLRIISEVIIKKLEDSSYVKEDTKTY